MASPDRREFLHAAPLAAVAANAREAPREKSTKPKFTLGLVTYNVASTWDLPTILKVCKGVGISPIELRTTHAHKVEPELSKEERKEVRKRFADSGVAFWGCGSTCDFHHTDPARLRKQIDLCKRFIELVADLGGKGVKVRPNDLPKGVPEAKTLAQIGKSLAECGKAASGEGGVEIWVEVHGRGTAHPPHMKTIMEECGDPGVGVTWNSNGTDLKDGSVAEYFKLLKPWIKSCHINDLYKDQSGGYPYRELFRLLKEINYDRATLIEVGRVWKDVDAGTEFLRYYKALWNEQTRG
jgi:sugar phosphate isomerase/epimerase